MRTRLLKIFELDPRSLAVFRMGLGTLLLVDLAIRSTDLVAHYSDAGMAPRSVVIAHRFAGQIWFPHFASGSCYYQAVLFAIAGITAICLTLGCKTRVATVVSWFLLVSLHHRNPLVINGGDVLLRMLLFWSMFLPLADRWSLDLWWKRRKRYVETEPAWYGCPIGSMATACLMFQIAAMYWTSGYWKLTGVWLQPDGLLQILHFDTYARAPAYVLLNFPQLLTYMGYGILWMEFLGPCLIFLPVWNQPFRMVAITTFFFVHLGIEMTLTVGLFSFVCWVAWLPLLPPDFWDSWLRETKRPAGRTDANASIVGTATGVKRWLVSILPVVCLVIIVAGNFALASGPVVSSPSSRLFGDLLLFSQKWSLFSNPPRRDGWYVMAADLPNGEVIDLLRDGAPADWISYAKPVYIYLRSTNHRWRKFYRQLMKNSSYDFREPLCRHLVHRWNRSHSQDKKVVHVSLYFMEELSGPFESDQFQQRLLYESAYDGQKVMAETSQNDTLERS